jgi:amino acid transporter
LSILVYTILLLAFTVVGNFRWNITLSAVARLLTYASFAVALLVLRKKSPEADAFRLRGGPIIAIFTLAFCVMLFMQTPLNNLSIVLGVIAIAALNWLLVRSSGEAPQGDT